MIWHLKAGIWVIPLNWELISTKRLFDVWKFYTNTEKAWLQLSIDDLPKLDKQEGVPKLYR